MNNSSSSSVFRTDESNRFVDKRRENVKSDLITITEVKLENILLKHIHKLGVRKSWLAPLSLLITVVIAKSTASFHATLGVDASVWEALFILLMVGSFVWLIITIINICRYWKESSLPNLLAIIKNIEDEKKIS
jgi:hypothetical protein